MGLGGSVGFIAALFSAFARRENAKTFRRIASLRLISSPAGFVTQR
jgi:hypothetical protein